jgi:MYXO-CTERM domain-containing protein
VPQRRAIVSLTLILTLGLPAAALANSKGIINQYGPAATCFNCHLPGQWMQGTINLTSPAYTGLKYTFSFTCTGPASGGVLPVAGVNVHATCGKLSLHPAETKTKLVSGQITHSQPKAATGSSVTYKFNWTAPASSTGCAFNVTGLLGNNNKLSSGDVTCQAMKGLLVLPVPDGGVPPQKDAGVPPKKDSGTTPKKDSGTTPKKDSGTTPKADSAAGSDAASSSTDGAGSADAPTAADLSVGPTPAPEEDGGCSCAVGALSPGAAAPGILVLGLLFGLIRRRR